MYIDRKTWTVRPGRDPEEYSKVKKTAEELRKLARQERYTASIVSEALSVRIKCFTTEQVNAARDFLVKFPRYRKIDNRCYMDTQNNCKVYIL